MRKRKNRKMMPIITIFIILLILGISSTIFALITAMSSKIIPNVRINNLKVSGMSDTEAEEKLEKIIESIIKDEIVLKHEQSKKTFTLKDMELKTNVIDKVSEACLIGRKENIIANNFKVISVLINGENLELDLSFNEEIMQSMFNTLDAEWEGKFIDNSYYIEGEELVIVKGKKGIVLDKEALKNSIKQAIYDKIEGKEIKDIEIPTKIEAPEEIDIEKIEKEVYKEAKNASYDKTSGRLEIHSNGVEFGISIEDAKQIIKENKEEYKIPLQVTMPQVTIDMLGENAFPNVLGGFSTRYDASDKNRGRNIELAAEAINGKVIMPGEKFSFNTVVGPTTKEKGYMPAGAYSGGKLVQDYGGGVCQVSSTLYNTVLFANLEIVERYNHSSVVGYVNPGRDATISYGTRDFKFANPRKYAIKVNAKATNGILEMEIRGIAEADDVEVELSSEKTETILCETKYVYDSTLEEGQEYVETWGANGAKSIAYKTIKKNGAIISKTVLSEDSYNPMVKIIKTGSKSKVK
ncbi:MAG: hypothetical protein HFJ51_01405 [Clostridia bacterium]|nr:hypothetical protein [Clostridia bacterium]